MTDSGGSTEARRIRHHRRFAMTHVTFEDQPVGGATVDVWQDADGKPCWSARVVMPTADVASAGTLAGRMREGRVIRGRVSLVGQGPTIRPRGPVLMEWRGDGPLLAVEPSNTG